MFKKVSLLEWQNLKANRWFHITLGIMSLLIFISIMNRSYHLDAYMLKVDELLHEETIQYHNYIADLDSVNAGLKEFSNQRTNPVFPFSLEIRLIPQAIFIPGNLSVIATGQSDVHEGTYPVRTFSDPINKATTFYNPVTDLIGGFDFAFVMVLLIPLLVIAISYNILSEERENGTLQLILSQPVSLLCFLFAKLLFRFMILYGSVLFILLFSFIVTGTEIFSILPDILALSVLIAIYLVFWFAVSLLVNLFNRSSSFNATTLIGIWVSLVLVVPTLLHLIVQQVHDIPPRSEALVNLRNAEEEAFSIDRDEILDRYFFEHPEFIEAAEGSNVDEQWKELYEFYKWFYIVRQNIAEAVAPIVDDYYGRLAEQQEFAGRIGTLSPAVILKESMSSLAGTSTSHYNHFHVSTERFRLDWMENIRNKMLREQFITFDDLNTLPQFSYNPADVHNGLGNSAMVLLFHLISVFGLILLFKKKQACEIFQMYISAFSNEVLFGFLFNRADS